MENEKAIKEASGSEKNDGVIKQMVEAIAGKDAPSDIKRKLSGRAMEYFMFLDD